MIPGLVIVPTWLIKSLAEFEMNNLEAEAISRNKLFSRKGIMELVGAYLGLKQCREFIKC